MKYQCVPYEPIEVVPEVHQVTARLLQMQLYLRGVTHLSVVCTDEHLQASLHHLNSHKCVKLVRVDASDKQLLVGSRFFIWLELSRTGPLI